jgi:hypothetical protein
VPSEISENKQTNKLIQLKKIKKIKNKKSNIIICVKTAINK